MHQHCTIEERDTTVFLANEQKTKWVTIITLITMFAEVGVGYWSGSMALLADGWHMASHALALFLSLVVYYLYRHPKFRSSFTFGGGKILSLGGYTSALLLVIIAVSMIVESFQRFSDQRPIHYPEALSVAVFGLFINLLCAYILHQKEEKVEVAHDHKNCSHNKLAPAGGHHHHHGHSHSHGHDHNHESAYVHILTDALTSLFAIGALLLAMWKGWTWADPLVGIVGGVVVLKWAVGLIKSSGMDLLDAHDESIDRANLVKTLETDGSTVVDMHLWKLAPGQVGGEIIIRRNADQPSSYYRDLVQKKFTIQHLIIEVV
ncbi:MAG: CDF family Co(II)/Ni(II) efflux transporter DmeF [Bdellovibrionota bacterium]